uniref:diphosphoinositol-pentakisphosphate 1-kinase n=1 Tax=Ditylenchus dipsaci TaxID=166011 RepID=A0A915E1L2_9BILA
MKLMLNKTLYLNETWELAERRWSKELREFRKNNKSENGSTDFDISKYPTSTTTSREFERFYLCVKNMADIVVPQEYGISEESKICVLKGCVQNPDEEDESLTRLDPRASEGIATPMRHVRTRLYFTSESHIHTLMNLIRYGGLCSPDDKKWQRAMNFYPVSQFNYMTQVVLMVYEDSREEGTKKEATERFHIELLFSPGLYPASKLRRSESMSLGSTTNTSPNHRLTTINRLNDKDSTTEVELSDSGTTTTEAMEHSCGVPRRKSSKDSSILYMKSNNASSSSTTTTSPPNKAFP